MTDIEIIVGGGLSGVAIYVIGQLLSKFLIDPLYELKKEVGNIRFNLAFYAPVIHTPIGRTPEKSEAARQALMDNSCSLIAKLHAVPGYTIVGRPNRKDMEQAARLLRGLSTYVHEDGDSAGGNIAAVNKFVCKIEKLLCLNALE